MTMFGSTFCCLLLLASTCSSNNWYIKLAPGAEIREVSKDLAKIGAHWLGEYSEHSRLHVFQFEGVEVPPSIPGIVSASRSEIPEDTTTQPTARVTTVHGDEDGFSITYEQCLASLKGKPNIKTIEHPIQWIHIPKAGTSIGATIYGYLCTNISTPFTKPNSSIDVNCTYCGQVGKGLNRGLYWDPKLRNMIPFSNKIRKDGTRHRFAEFYAPYCDWTQTPYPPYSNHHPLQIKVRKGGATSPIALFRDPRKRLVSAWNNDKHTYGVGSRRDEIKSIQTLDEFVRHPSIPGCQAKMMIGRVCADYRTIKPKELEHAKQRLVNDLVFVGLTDSFNASVCLFHHMHGGTPLPYMFQTVGKERSGKFLFESHKNERSKIKPLPGGGQRVHPDAWLDIDPSADPSDTELYATARTIFRKRLEEYEVLRHVHR